MAEEKKYYWLKLRFDFFRDPKIVALESMDKGKDYELMYLKLMCESANNNGILKVDDIIPYNTKMIANVTNTDADTVVRGIEALKKLGMVEVIDGDTLYLKQVSAIVGSSADNAHAIRQERYRRKQISQGVTESVTQGVTNSDVDIRDKSIDIRDKSIDTKDKYNTPAKAVVRKFVKPTVEEVATYCKERNNNVDPESFIDFYESKGWMVGSNHMKDWKAAVRTWERNRKPKNDEKANPEFDRYSLENW